MSEFALVENLQFGFELASVNIFSKMSDFLHIYKLSLSRTRQQVSRFKCISIYVGLLATELPRHSWM